MTTDDRNGSVMQGENWDLESEYAAPDSAGIEADLARLTALLDEIERLNPVLIPAIEIAGELTADSAQECITAARRIFTLSEAAAPLLRDPGVYANCLLSVDSGNDGAQALLGRLQAYRKRFVELAEPLSQLLDRAPDDVVEAWLGDEATAPARFSVEHSRKRRHELLSVAEETLASALAEDGIHAWGRLYNQLSGTLACEVTVAGERRTMGLAEASGLMLKPDDALRRERVAGHQRGLGGARRILRGRDQRHRRMAPRDVPETLAGGRSRRSLPRRPPAPQPHLAGDPGDAPRGRRGVRAPRPPGRPSEGPRLPQGAIRALGPAGAGSRGRSVGGERRSHRVRGGGGHSRRVLSVGRSGDGRVRDDDGREALDRGDRGRTQAPRRLLHRLRPIPHPARLHDVHGRRERRHHPCPRARPRVPLLGDARSPGLPAALRDVARGDREHLRGDGCPRTPLLQRAATPAEELPIVWEEATALVAFILNIPARFEFEKSFCEARAERPFRPAELDEMMSAAWEKWYGDCLSEPDPHFWASKLHFYISGPELLQLPRTSSDTSSAWGCARAVTGSATNSSRATRRFSATRGA